MHADPAARAISDPARGGKLIGCVRVLSSATMASDMRPTPPAPMSSGDSVEIHIGERSFPAVVVSSDPSVERREVVVSADAAALLQANPDLSLPARVWLLTNDPPGRESSLVGAVMEFRQHGPTSWHLRILELGLFANMLTGGLGIRDVSKEEYLWSMGRDAGFPPSRLNFPSFRPPDDYFLVVIPVEGLEPDADLAAGDVLLTSNATHAKTFVGLGPADLQGQFIDTGIWAVTHVAAAPMWDAEREAERRVARVLGRISLGARYSMAVGADGALRAYDATTHPEQPRLRSISGVAGSRTKRMWLRGFRNTLNSKPVGPRIVSGLIGAISFPEERVDEAITAWLRASNEPDSAAAAVALSEALEFYAAGSHVPQLFTSTQLGLMKKASLEAIALALPKVRGRKGQASKTPALSPEDRVRREHIAQRIGDFNNPPAAVLLRAALDADAVPCTDKEFELILRIRGVRRSVLHGHAREALDPNDLRQGLALVNRLLIARLRRLASASQTERKTARTRARASR